MLTIAAALLVCLLLVAVESAAIDSAAIESAAAEPQDRFFFFFLAKARYKQTTSNTFADPYQFTNSLLNFF